jgi:hypothetical protein
VVWVDEHPSVPAETAKGIAAATAQIATGRNLVMAVHTSLMAKLEARLELHDDFTLQDGRRNGYRISEASTPRLQFGWRYNVAPRDVPLSATALRGRRCQSGSLR